ncbi:MAG TPA: hypothetical protein VJB66_01565 [Candidatus Nanoarchaeia archaeon]|nr:hypothetical protein [Candidatus Nanoarchaeia archaeon]
MNKIIWISTALASFIVSIIINFNVGSISGFLIGSIILALILFGILTLITLAVKNAKEKNAKRSALFWVLSVTAIIFFSFGYLLFGSFSCAQAIQPAHFRTNIMTGHCDYGGYATCLIGDPWYYTSDCDISNQEKFTIFKKTEWYDQLIGECNALCQQGNSGWYCRSRISDVGSDISCEDLISCDKISCN